jgi:hypothetical protein
MDAGLYERLSADVHKYGVTWTVGPASCRCDTWNERSPGAEARATKTVRRRILQRGVGVPARRLPGEGRGLGIVPA